jgi:hypothetical protein
MNHSLQLAWCRLRAGLAPRGSESRKHWSAEKDRVRALKRTEGETAEWNRRIAEVLACPDLNRLPRVAQAGTIVGNDQIMHTGLKVALGSYYSAHAQRLLVASRGVHEPQEEWVFAEVLKQMRPGALMLELGAYWAFYSLWFHQQVPNARNVMVEPDMVNLNAGRLNFALNGWTGDFFRGFLGERYEAGETPLVSVDWLAEQFKLSHIHLLHSDIQGYELAMLRGAKRMLGERRVDYIFVSTHSEDLHRDCQAFLQAQDYVVIAEHNLAQSYAVDGLIVARRKELPGLEHVEISRKPA